VDEELSQEVETLVAQLANDDPRARDDAERNLLALGVRILPLLPDLASRTSAEIQLRLARIRRQLEQLESEAATQPTRVTLQGEFTLTEALRAIESQTGNRVLNVRDPATDRLDESKIKVDFQDVAFWSAIEVLMHESQTRLHAYSGRENTLALRPRGAVPFAEAADRPVSRKGIIRAELQRLALVRDWRSSPRDRLRLDVELVWEPRLSPLELQIPLDRMSAEDELGNVILPITRSDRQTLIVSNQVGGAQVSWLLHAPRNTADTLRAVTATINALLPGTLAEFSFQQLEESPDQRQQRAGVTVTMQEVRHQNNLSDVRILVEYDRDSPAFESHRGWIHHNPAYLRDAEGTTIQPQGMEIWRQQGAHYGLSYRFDRRDLRGLTLVYRTPMTFLSVPVPVRFEKVPLP
jgi:hypothetical protein